MTSLSEQLSAVRKSQVEAQFRLFHSITSQAFDNASRVMALNLALSRESMERSSRTVRQLLAATGPRDLIMLRTHAEEQMHSMLAYSRELFGLASGMRPYSVPLAAPAVLAAPQVAPQLAQAAQDVIETAAPVVETSIDSAADAVQAGAGVVEQAATRSAEVAADASQQAIAAADQALAALVQEQALKDEPAVVQSLEAADAAPTPVDEPAPVAKPKPIARAAGKGAPKAAVAPHPMAAPVGNKDSATVTRIDATPPKRRK